MELDCPNCGSICNISYDNEQTTEEHPLFCPFCGENIDELFCEELDEEDNEDYLERLVKHELGLDEPELD
jgi:hypothetical protein